MAGCWLLDQPPAYRLPLDADTRWHGRTGELCNALLLCDANPCSCLSPRVAVLAPSPYLSTVRSAPSGGCRARSAREPRLRGNAEGQTGGRGAARPSKHVRSSSSWRRLLGNVHPSLVCAGAFSGHSIAAFPPPLSSRHSFELFKTGKLLHQPYITKISLALALRCSFFSFFFSLWTEASLHREDLCMWALRCSFILASNSVSAALKPFVPKPALQLYKQSPNS